MTTTWVEGDKGRAVAISVQPGYAAARALAARGHL